MWEAEQQIEVDNIPIELKHQRELQDKNTEHTIQLQKVAQAHMNVMKSSAQQHQQELDKIKINKTEEAVKRPIKKKE